MGRSSELFMEMRMLDMQPDEYFELLNNLEYEESIERKYGYGLTKTLIMSENKDLLLGRKPTLEDLDNLFEIEEDE